MKHNEEYYKRRDEILRIAHHKFVKNGYQKTSVSAIMNELDIAKGAFYHYFSSKDEVLDIIIEQSLCNTVTIINSVCNLQDYLIMDQFKDIIILFSRWVTSFTQENSSLVHNEILHYRSIKQALITVSPIIESLLKKKHNGNEISVSNPKEISEIIVCVIYVIFQKELFTKDNQSIAATLDIVYSIIYSSNNEKGVTI